MHRANSLGLNQVVMQEARPLLSLFPDPEMATPHGFWRATYLTMIENLPNEAIEEFFNNHPQVWRGERLSTLGLLEKLFSPTGEVPLGWNYVSSNDLERFLIRWGIAPIPFFKRMLMRSGMGSYLPGDWMLIRIYPEMKEQFNPSDSRSQVIRLLTLITEGYLPHHLHRPLFKRETNESVEVYMGYSFDRKFSVAGPFNFDFIALEQIRSAPRVLNLPPFEIVKLIAEAGQILQVAPECEALQNSELSGFSINGHVISQPKGFYEFLAEKGLGELYHAPPDAEGQVMLEDWICPIRRRVVLHKGCFYGAPIFVTEIRYTKIVHQGGQFLLPLVEEINSRLNEHLPESIRRRHQELITKVSQVNRFVFIAAEECVMLGSELLIRGIPAMILKRILQRFHHEGRRKFSHSEFRRDPEIGGARKSMNFELRLNRLESRLEKSHCGLHIKRNEPGFFTLVSKRPFHYSEE